MIIKGKDNNSGYSAIVTGLDMEKNHLHQKPLKGLLLSVGFLRSKLLA